MRKYAAVWCALLLFAGIYAYAGTGQDTLLVTDTVYSALVTKINDDMTELFVIAAEVAAARDGETNLLTKINVHDTAIAALAAGSGVVVSANDTTAGFLNGKLIVGDGIDFTENNDGANETLTISCEDGSATNKGILELATDAETQAGIDTERAITAANLQACTATTSRKGVIEVSTDAECVTGSSTSLAVVPSNLTAVSFPRLLAKTADYPVTSADLKGNTIITNKSAGAEVNLTLPAATTGLTLECEVRTAQYLKCTANGTDTFEWAGNASAAGGYIRSNTAGTSWKVQCREAGKWTVLSMIGVLKYDE